jgi:hypothetical protein
MGAIDSILGIVNRSSTTKKDPGTAAAMSYLSSKQTKTAHLDEADVKDETEAEKKKRLKKEKEEREKAEKERQRQNELEIKKD